VCSPVRDVRVTRDVGPMLGLGLGLAPEAKSGLKRFDPTLPQPKRIPFTGQSIARANIEQTRPLRVSMQNRNKPHSARGTAYGHPITLSPALPLLPPAALTLPLLRLLLLLCGCRDAVLRSLFVPRQRPPRWSMR
jgi:hypothetical protein